MQVKLKSSTDFDTAVNILRHLGCPIEVVPPTRSSSSRPFSSSSDFAPPVSTSAPWGDAQQRPFSSGGNLAPSFHSGNAYEQMPQRPFTSNIGQVSMAGNPTAPFKTTLDPFNNPFTNAGPLSFAAGVGQSPSDQCSQKPATQLPYTLSQVMPPRRELPFGDESCLRPTGSSLTDSRPASSRAFTADGQLPPTPSSSADPVVSDIVASPKRRRVTDAPVRPSTSHSSCTGVAGNATTQIMPRTHDSGQASREPLVALTGSDVNSRSSNAQAINQSTGGPTPAASDLATSLNSYAAQSEHERQRSVNDLISECLQDDHFWVLYEDVWNAWQRTIFDDCAASRDP